MSFYYTLITSLPRHGRQFKVKETPISKIQLEKRLSLLSDSDNKILNDIVSVVWDSWFSLYQIINETNAAADKLLLLKNAFITQIIRWYFDVRSILVALRLRKLQQTAPTNSQDFWLTRWNKRLINNWHEPDFGLKYSYSWLQDFVQKFQKDDTAGLEEILMTQLWKHLDNIETRHYFDFEAIIIYMLRWKIVNYWSQFNEVVAIEKINIVIPSLAVGS